jgi:hypothetical protein
MVPTAPTAPKELPPAFALRRHIGQPLDCEMSDQAAGNELRKQETGREWQSMHNERGAVMEHLRRLVFIAAFAALACDRTSNTNRVASGSDHCIPGASVACACVGGTRGAQVCLPNGTFGSCGCGPVAPLAPIAAPAPIAQETNIAPSTETVSPDASDLQVFSSGGRFPETFDVDGSFVGDVYVNGSLALRRLAPTRGNAFPRIRVNPAPPSMAGGQPGQIVVQVICRIPGSPPRRPPAVWIWPGTQYRVSPTVCGW